MQVDFSRNHFELFGLPVAFEIDLDVLTQRYRELQRAVHPDKFANAGDRERRLSVQQAAHINEAYRTLRDILPRARYLLEVHQVAINDQSNTVMDPEFLMQQMELRERLEAVRETADPHAALREFMTVVDDEHKRLEAALARQFATVNEESLRQAHGLTLRLQFLDRLHEEAEDLDDELAHAH